MAVDLLGGADLTSAFVVIPVDHAYSFCYRSFRVVVQGWHAGGHMGFEMIEMLY